MLIPPHAVPFFHGKMARGKETGDGKMLVSARGKAGREVVVLR